MEASDVSTNAEATTVDAPVEQTTNPIEGCRVIVISHGVTEQTGFGQQMRKVAVHLQRNGCQVFAAHPRYRGIPITPRELDGVVILPWGNDPQGADCMHYYIDLIRPHIVISLADIWDKQFLAKQNCSALKHQHFDWIGWFPFDTSNCVGFWQNNLSNMSVPVVMSEFGRDLMGTNGLFGVHIPHSFDANEYSPASEEKRAELKKKFGVAGKFVVLCVAHNQVRKKMDRVLQAFAKFAKDKPDAVLWLHSQPHDASGWDLLGIANDLGIGDKIMFSNKASKLIADSFVTNPQMADMYRAADCHLLLTGGEGFGLPILESAACGTPNITTNFTTGPELVPEGTGFLVKVLAKEMHMNGGYWAFADIDHAAECIQKYYDDPELRTQHGRAAAKYVHDKYTDDKVLPKWLDLILQLPTLRDMKTRFYFGKADSLQPVRPRGR